MLHVSISLDIIIVEIEIESFFPANRETAAFLGFTRP